MDRFFKNPAAIVSVICWLVLGGLCVAVLLTTRTVDDLSGAQTQLSSRIDAAENRGRLAEAHNASADAKLAEHALALEEQQQKTAADAAKTSQDVTALKAKVETLAQTVEERRKEASETAAKAGARLDDALTRIEALTRAANGAGGAVVFARLTQTQARGGMHFDGAGGRDSMHGLATPVLFFDGSRMVSIETINIKDRRATEVRIAAPGLLNLEDDFMELRLDADRDSVVLDGCLSWKQDAGPLDAAAQKRYGTADGAIGWTATDAAGETRRVAVTPGARVTVAPACNSDYAGTVAARDDAAIGRPELSELHSRVPGGRWDIERGPEPYKPDTAAIADLYDRWAKDFPVADAQPALAQIAAAVRAGRLPADFMSGDGTGPRRRIRQLDFNPAQAVVKTGAGKFDCQAARAESRFVPLVVHGDGVETICDSGDHVFALRDGADVVTITGGGQNIFIPGKGTDVINAGRSAAIIWLGENWGKKTINKTCAARDAARALPVEKSPGESRVYGGIGLPLENGLEGTQAGQPFPGSPAEAGGIMRGDRLLTVNGSPLPPESEEVAARIRGDAGTKVTLGIETAATHLRRDVTLTRAAIANPFRPQQGETRLLDYHWPYPYEDFILFAPGISEGDLREAESGHWINTKTGDSLELSPCFNFVFSAP